MGATLFDKVWNSHVVRSESEDVALLYVDRHLVRDSGCVGGRAVRRPLASALRTLIRNLQRSWPRDFDGEPNPHIYFCPSEPAALPFGWQAFDERTTPSGRGDHRRP